MRRLNLVQGPRQCGGCTACCTEMEVVEISKPMHKACQYVTGSGCGAYEIRPLSCREFECMWMEEMPPHLRHPLDDEDRPDKCGVLFTATGDATFTQETGIPLLVARGDFEKGARTLAKMAQWFLLLLVHRDGRRSFVGRTEWVEVAKQCTFHEYGLNDAEIATSAPVFCAKD